MKSNHMIELLICCAKNKDVHFFRQSPIKDIVRSVLHNRSTQLNQANQSNQAKTNHTEKQNRNPNVGNVKKKSDYLDLNVRAIILFVVDADKQKTIRAHLIIMKSFRSN